VVTASAEQGWFIAGTIPLIVAGGLHAVCTVIDAVRPTFFTPIDASAKPVVEGTGIRLVRMFGGSGERPSMWRVWLGINVSHGLGIFAFALLCLLIAVDDFTLIERIDAIRPLAVAFSAALLVLALRFWFYGPVVITAAATACFTIATVLSS
jgi:hypothetical protein